MLLEKGHVFSTDLMVSFIALVGIMFLIASISANFSKEKTIELKKTVLEKNAIFLADSIVKNFDKNNAFYGNAFSDPEKRRIKPNELNENFENFFVPENSEFFVKKISIKSMKSGLEKTFFEEGKDSANCIAIERFVLIAGQKANFLVMSCET